MTVYGILTGHVSPFNAQLKKHAGSSISTNDFFVTLQVVFDNSKDSINSAADSEDFVLINLTNSDILSLKAYSMIKIIDADKEIAKMILFEFEINDDGDLYLGSSEPHSSTAGQFEYRLRVDEGYKIVRLSPDILSKKKELIDELKRQNTTIKNVNCSVTKAPFCPPPPPQNS